MKVDLTLPQIKALIRVAAEGLADMEARSLDAEGDKQAYGPAARGLGKLMDARDKAKKESDDE